ncbi:MAG: hypothetical protein ABIL09_01650 [Gemmatimonadota bacterium]
MLAITYFLIAHPLVAVGLAILVLLCVYNVLRRQARTALGLWLLAVVVLVYIYAKAAAGIVEPPPSTRTPAAAAEGRRE